VLCDRKMPVAVKGKIYRTMVRPVLIYGSETWTLKRREEERLERTEMRKGRGKGVRMKGKVRRKNEGKEEREWKGRGNPLFIFLATAFQGS